MNKEDLEKQKLQVEIDQLNRPFWKNPTIVISSVTVILSALIGFSSYFNQVDQDNVEKIKELKELIQKQEAVERKIELQNLQLQKTQIENEAKELEQQLLILAEEVEQKKAILQTKNNALAKLKLQLAEEKIRSKTYLEKVSQVTAYMADYGPGYAKGLLSSTSGVAKIKEITNLDDPSKQAEEIENFTLSIVNKTFKKYLQKKGDEIRLIGN